MSRHLIACVILAACGPRGADAPAPAVQQPAGAAARAAAGDVSAGAPAAAADPNGGGSHCLKSSCSGGLDIEASDGGVDLATPVPNGGHCMFKSQQDEQDERPTCLTAER